MISIEVSLKIARMGIVMIPGRHKTIFILACQYHVDAGIVLVMILDVLAIPNDTEFVRYCQV